MKPILTLCLAASSVLCGSLFAPASAQTVAIPGLFNTGVNAAGNATLADGSPELHYTIIAGPAGFSPTAFVLNNQLNGTYFQSPNSKWIWQNANGQPGSTTFTFRLVFNLTGLDPATASLSGRYGTDNNGFIQLNGGANSFALTGGSGANFATGTTFAFNTGFVAGVNTLDFVVTDVGAPSALNVTDLTGTAQVVGSNVAPEPGTLALLLTGLAAGTRFAARRRHIV